MIDEALIHRRHALLYILDSGGRMVGSNDPCGRGEPPPLAHVCLGRGAVKYALRADLTAAVAKGLSTILSSLQPLTELRDRSVDVRLRDSILRVHGVSMLHSGPVFRFHDIFDSPPNAVLVDRRTAGVLRRGFADLIDHLAFVQPCFARLVDGQAVSICQTVRVNGQDREAGVETLPPYRGRGYGSEVVAAWAHELQRRDLIPIYSTSWDNHASLGIARRLRLFPFAVEFGIR